MKNWRFWIGILISVIFIYFSLRGLELSQVWGAMQNARYAWLLPGIAVYFVGVWVRTWRWHYMLRPLKKIPTANMFPIVTIGYMGNNIYPARAGEVLRAVLLRQREGVPISASLATIIVERIFDGVVMLAFVFLNLPELARLTGEYRHRWKGSISRGWRFGVRSFLLGRWSFFCWQPCFPKSPNASSDFFIQRFIPERFREKSLDISLRFLSGLEALRSPFEAMMIFFTTVLIWLLETAKYWFVMQAFDFHVSFFALMLMNGIVNLATTMPSAPGYVGTFDLPGIAVLVAYGVSRRGCHWLYPGAACRVVVPNHTAGCLLLLPPAAALGQESAAGSPGIAIKK